jgi:hypothetical protein
MRTLFISLFILSCFAFNANAQLFLNLEQIGSPKGKRIYPGKTITFKIEGDEMWRTSELYEIITETNLLVFEDQVHKLSDILYIRDDSRKSWSTPLGTSLFTFGASWSFFAGGASLFDDTFSYSVRDAIIGGGSMLLGTGIRRIFRYKTLDLKKNYNLRIIDLRI